jgi:hypothetical protein
MQVPPDGPGRGFVDQFDTGGHFLRRFASGTSVGGQVGQLNAPWGLVAAPSNYGPGGKFSNALLVGNFGDSHVSAVNIVTGALLGQLSDAAGRPLTLNGGFQGQTNTEGLWGLKFGNGAGGTAKNALYFTSGINDEENGLFGKVTLRYQPSVTPPDAVVTPQTADAVVASPTQDGWLPSIERPKQPSVRPSKFTCRSSTTLATAPPWGVANLALAVSAVSVRLEESWEIDRLYGQSRAIRQSRRSRETGRSNTAVTRKDSGGSITWALGIIVRGRLGFGRF